MPKVTYVYGPDGQLQSELDYRSRQGLIKEHCQAEKTIRKAAGGSDASVHRYQEVFWNSVREKKNVTFAELVQKVYEHAKLEPVFLQAEDAAEATAGQEQVLARIQNAMGDLGNVRRTLRVRKPTARGTEYAAARAVGRDAGSGTTA